MLKMDGILIRVIVQALRHLLAPSSKYEIRKKFRSLLAEAADLCELFDSLLEVSQNPLAHNSF